MFAMLPLFFFTACKQKETKHPNPFFSEFNTPFQVPPFDQIDTSDYLPAVKKGIARQQAEIDSIVNNPAAPTFDNTIMAYNNSGKLLTRVIKVFECLNSSNTNPAMQALARQIDPMITNHRDNIALNEKFFLRIKTVYDNREKDNLDADQKRVVEKYYNDFVRDGANLSDADKAKLREINQKLSLLELKFDENLLAETNENFKLVIDKQEDLDGLPQGVIDAAAETAKEDSLPGKWVFTLQKPSMIPFLQYDKNRDLREKIYTGYFMRGNHNDAFDNKQVFLDIMNLRSEKARLLGYKTYSDYILVENMAKTPANVYDFLHKIMAPALVSAKKDRDAMQQIIGREGGKFMLASWDWWYYAEKLRKEKYDLAESELKPYLSLSDVRDGMFYVANQLYGITFSKLTNVPVYHPEVEAFEVKDGNGAHLGVLYIDYYPRSGKRAGAWCETFRDQGYENGKKIYPVVSMVCNFTRPTATLPALLSWDETTTLFHEFGHALHALFTDGKYKRTAGDLPNDMVELPSQIMENWAAEPAVLKVYAKNYKTGEVIPQVLIDKLKKSGTFNEGFMTSEYIAAAILDMDWHTRPEAKQEDVLQFEKASMDRIHLIPEILPRYRTTYFSHVMGGYAAGYYVYLWAAVLDSDAFDDFVQSGDIFNKEIATRFRKYILTEGGANDGMVQYRKFRGQDPSLQPLLKKRGLN